MQVKFFLVGVLCMCINLVSAQQPAYFVLGEDQFRGIQIYDVIQDKDLNFWFATNEGIFWFNSVNYEKVECEKAKSYSAFNFVINEQGTIYCHNLNNQVFEIKNKRCRLFYELKEKEGSADVTLTIADDGNLLIGSKQVIVLNQDSKVVNRYIISNHYLGPSFTTKKKKVQYHLSESDTVLSYSAGKFSLHKLKHSNTPPLHVLKFYQVHQHAYALDLNTKINYRYDALSYSLSPTSNDSTFQRSEWVRLYETDAGLWIASTLPGVAYSGKQLTSAHDEVFFDNYFISDVYQDGEGNILLSTFDKGVLVIPDLKVPDVINDFEDDPVTSLFSDNQNGLILGSSKGKLMCFSDGQLKTLSETGKRPIEGISGYTNGDWYIFDDGFIRAYNNKTGQTIDLLLASLKDAVFISPKEVFLGTNRGVVKLDRTGASTFELKYVENLNSRVHFMDYDSKNKSLYVSTANGLFQLLSSGKIKSIRYNGEELYPIGIHYAKGKVYISTKDNGILIIEKGKIIGQIKPIVNSQVQVVKKIFLYKGTIIAQSSHGLFQFDRQGNLLKTLHVLFGFTSKRVIDFTFHKGILWVSHSGGVQQIDLNYSVSTPVKPLVRIDKIVVNNLKQETQKTPIYTSSQNKFQFFYSSPTLRNRETILYYYRLVGYDSIWSTADHVSNQVTYNALAPGNYTFEIMISNQGELSTVQSFSFTIKSPIYVRWWFILLSVLLFIGIVFFIYRWQLSVQRKKSERINELNASKLTAIQSQMNPHFIFNSLNSIQDLILKGDVEHSYSYITTFSNLVRRTLSYSEKDFIDFEQELKLLELYLSLEKLRFKKDFDYVINYSDVEDIMLPPLLVQPFIENSLVHGLLHKEGPKRLTITFRMEEVLVCIIKDNGIGRKAAQAIKQRQRIEHESFSGKAIHHRFEILSNVFDGKFGYTYEDLEENGQAIGTRVILHIPVKQKF